MIYGKCAIDFLNLNLRYEFLLKGWLLHSLFNLHIIKFRRIIILKNWRLNRKLWNLILKISLHIDIVISILNWLNLIVKVWIV